MLRIGCLLFCSLLIGQMQQRKTWDASTIESIHLEFPWASSITINTHDDPRIEAQYQTEGEYQDLYLLKSSVVGVRFYLEEYQRPNWNNPGDKLSAHKVVANMISLTIPKGLYLSLCAKETQLNCSRLKILNFEKLEQISHSEEHLVVACVDSKNYIIGTLCYAIPTHICPTVIKYAKVLTVIDGTITGHWNIAARDHILN